MKAMDITDFTNIYASFMRLKENPETVDVQILKDVADEDVAKGNNEEA